MALEDALLDILVCPIDKRGLLYFADDAVLYNPRLSMGHTRISSRASSSAITASPHSRVP